MMVNRRGQTSMPYAGFEPMVSASKRSRPTPHSAQPLGPGVYVEWVRMSKDAKVA
jgi:hypothetical protein